MTLQAYRKTHGLKQREVAERLGWSVPYVCRFELAQTGMSVERANQLVAFTGGAVSHVDIESVCAKAKSARKTQRSTP